ncbi:MAG: PEP-CTERM sorting domain-containing protein [Akkermansia sp.]
MKLSNFILLTSILLSAPCLAFPFGSSTQIYDIQSGSSLNLAIADATYGSVTCAGTFTANSLTVSDDGGKDGSLTISDGGQLTTITSLSAVSLDIQDENTVASVGTNLDITGATTISQGATLNVTADATVADLSISGDTTTANFGGSFTSSGNLSLSDSCTLALDNAVNLNDVLIEDGSTLTLRSGSTLIVDGVLTINADTFVNQAMMIIEEGADLSSINEINIIMSDEAYDNWSTDSANYLISDEAGSMAVMEDIGFTISNESGTASSDDISYDQVVKTDAVPEPSTATLSLLALAALCARRRRK